MEGLLHHSYSSTLNFLKGRGQDNAKHKKIPKSEPKATNMLTRWLRDLRGSTILRSNSNLEDQSPTLSTKQKTIQVSRSQSTLVAHKPTRKKNNDNRRYSFNDHALQNQKRTRVQCNGYESKRRTRKDIYADSIMMPSRSTPNLQQETQSGTKLYRSSSRDAESPPPAPPVRDSSTLKSVKYGPGHEKFPSWPVPAAAETPHALRGPPSGGSHRSKSWTDHTNYPKEQVVTYTRPYMKRQHSQTQQKLKTVMERCEKINGDSYERRLYLPHVDRDGKQLGDADYVVPSPPERDTCKPQLTQADLEQYAHLYQQETSENNKYPAGQTELESFIKYSLYPHSNGVRGEDGILMHLQAHQKQLSYAQSEGYHSYVSSADSTSTPFLDRLRRDSDAVPGRWSDDDNRREGRDSVVTTSSGSASSSETLKWHGSMSDVSIASSCTHLASNKQLIAHSARVQTPQRHHSESVLFMSSGTNDASPEGWKHKESRKNNANKLKLFPVNTYTVKDDLPSNRLSDSLTVADRINELEKQQKYSYLDPDKKHKIPDPTLKAIQKKALLSFYERHQSNKTNWRSEPQLTPATPLAANATQSVNPQPQPQRHQTQLPSRRASSASDYSSNNVSKRSSMAPKHQHSNSYGSLTTDLLGPIIMGPSISLDDWVPERPPKNPHLRTAYPDLFREQRVPSPDLPPPPPPTELDEEVFANDDPLPPPPTELEAEAWNDQERLQAGNALNGGGNSIRENTSSHQYSAQQVPAPQVAVSSANYVNEDDMKKHIVGLPESGKKSAREQLGITVTRSPSKRVVGSVAVNQKVGSSKPMRAEPLFDKKPVVKLQQRASFAESSSKDCPPPLQPRQMRVNQSMRAKMSDHRPKAVALRISPSTESQKQHMMKPTSPGSPNYQNQSKASYLASRRERERIVPDSDTGSYKRTISPNGHAIANDYQQTQCPKETILKKNNNNVNIIRRASMNDKSMKIEEKEKHPIILPDVLPVNVKMMAPCYLSLPPASIDGVNGINGFNTTNGNKKSPKASPPSSPSKSPYNSLRCTLISTPPFVQTPPTPPASPRIVTRPVLTAERTRTTLRTPSTCSPASPRSPISPVSRGSPAASRSPTTGSPPALPSLLFSVSSPVKTSPPTTPTSPVPTTISVAPRIPESPKEIKPTETDTKPAEKVEAEPPPVATLVPHQRKKLQEEIDCERLSEDFVNQLPTSAKLKDILVQGPDYKKPTDYVNGLFKLEITSRPRPANSPFSRSRTNTPSSSPPPSSTIHNANSTSTISESPSALLRLEPVSPLSATSPYFTTSEPKARLLTRYSQDMNHLNIVKDTKDLSQKKDELISRLDRKLEVLRSEQLDLTEECRINEELGQNVEDHVQRLARPHEASKFRLHVEEVGKITSLLLSLSGRLARAENALMSTYEDYAERRILETKRNKLLDQLEEAKKLKECIDKRSLSVSTILNKYLSSEEYADYDHFINMKAKLLMDSKEIADKIKLGEEQLTALKETLIIGS
ncbi:protein Shroom isoform X2 [Atheta coriaria]|uniref:protein Shroom isoform X2 n=1 Tax=Dalotia coriaria TaxID=877792 RepID=UPI0031F3E083